MINDLISDSLTRIRNAAMRKREGATLMHSKVIESIAEIFKAKGYIEDFTVVAEGNKKFINVVLKYDETGKSVINEIKRVSKPGRRIYRGKEDIKRFKNGYGTIVVSTSKGVLANDAAYAQGIGGEVLCTIW